MSSIENENKWVYLMDQNYQTMRFKDKVLESSEVIQGIMRGIEKNIDEKESVKIVIFLPWFEIDEIKELVNSVASESSTQLQEVNHNLEQLLFRIKKANGVNDPEEVIQSVELPSDEWIELVDDFIQSEYPELKIDNTETPLPDPVNSYKSDENSLACIKQRALDWIKPKVYDGKFVGKFCIFSLINAILPKSVRESEELSPSLVKYFIKWHDLEFCGIGNKLASAREDAAINAISRLLDINVKTYIAPSKTKLLNYIMPKIKLDKVSAQDTKELYEMSIKLPITGQVVKGNGNSLYNAKQRTFLLASRLFTTEKRLAVERSNKSLLLEFYKKECGDEMVVREVKQEKTSDDVINDDNHNETHTFGTTLSKEELKQLKTSGLENIKPYLTRSSYSTLHPSDILHKFLPSATISELNKLCVIQYKDRLWSISGKSEQESVETAVITVLNELFGIKLVSTYYQERPELKEKLQTQALTAKNEKRFTSTIAYDGTIFKASGKEEEKSIKGVVRSVLVYVKQKYVEDAQMKNRISISKCLINRTASLFDRVKFILDYFSFGHVNGKSSFESTDWLLMPFERVLLDEMNNNVKINQISEKFFKATILINNKTITTIDSTGSHAKHGLILSAFKQLEENEDTFIIVSKPIEAGDSSDICVKKFSEISCAKGKVSYYRKKALDTIYGNNFRTQRKRGYIISPLCILHNVLAPEKINIVQDIQVSTNDYRVTIELAGQTVTGIASTKRDAKQEACRLLFINILKIDWDRASQGYK